MSLPADGHVHSQFSWDAPKGAMAATCARAVEIGLPVVAFTEHVDHTVWTVAQEWLDESEHFRSLAVDGVVTPPPFDVTGYLASIAECRDRFPSLRILTGLELGEPHWHATEAAALLKAGSFDRVLGSLHNLPYPGGYAEPSGLIERAAQVDVMRQYLAEIPRLVAESDVFAVLAHIDYPVRSWAGDFDPHDFEDEYRYALRSLAATDRALEINTRVPLHPEILRWWRDEGGRAVTFGSDAHYPEALAAGLPAASAMAEAHGFRPGRHPYDFWRL